MRGMGASLGMYRHVIEVFALPLLTLFHLDEV